MTIRGSHPSAVLVPVPAVLGLAQVRCRVGTGAGICGSASHEAAKAEGVGDEGWGGDGGWDLVAGCVRKCFEHYWNGGRNDEGEVEGSGEREKETYLPSHYLTFDYTVGG